MKLTVMPETMLRPHRKFIKGLPSKRPVISQHRLIAAKKEEIRMSVDLCDNSNDSGLGFDHHTENKFSRHPAYSFDQETCWANNSYKTKKKKFDGKLESEDANDHFTFPIASLTTPGVTTVNMVRPIKIASKRVHHTGPITLTSQLSPSSRDGSVSLQILSQPEQQHRARYQTEGSRGAVKDRTGNGFPIVKLSGYTKATTLQVFIGTDQGRVMPHMFYQACRVQGKNSTPCVEKKVDGTILIELDVDPANNMNVTCDCVGILKERNVDVEHRFPGESPTRSKKKSTRCRMVFRTAISHPDGTTEVLQVASQPIACTQLPGVPEICKKSLTSCPASGGLELYIIGKNFLKDTKVVFQETEGDATIWEQSVSPDKEFLQQSHLVCAVPPFKLMDIVKPVSVYLSVISSGRVSEPHTFVYTPLNSGTQTSVLDQPKSSSSLLNFEEMQASKYRASEFLNLPSQSSHSPEMPVPDYLAASTSQSEVHPVMMWAAPVESSSPESPTKHPLRGKPILLPPPPLIPLGDRRASVSMIVPDVLPPPNLKTELENSSQIITSDTKQTVPIHDLTPSPPPLSEPQTSCLPLLATSEAPNMVTLNHLVSEQATAPLLTQSGQSVEKYLSRLENSPPAQQEHTFHRPKPEPRFINYQMPSTSIDNTVFNPPNVSIASESSKESVGFSSSSVPITNSEVLQVFSDTNRTAVIVHPMMLPQSTIPNVSLNVPTQVMGDQMKPLIPETQAVSIDSSVPISSTVAPSATEGLDAFVNSTVECHIGTGSNLCSTQPIETPVLQSASSLSMPLMSHSVSAASGSAVVETLQSPSLFPPVIDKKPEVEIPQDLKNMSDNDLLKFINPSCFDQV